MGLRQENLNKMQRENLLHAQKVCMHDGMCVPLWAERYILSSRLKLQKQLADQACETCLYFSVHTSCD